MGEAIRIKYPKYLNILPQIQQFDSDIKEYIDAMWEAKDEEDAIEVKIARLRRQISDLEMESRKAQRMRVCREFQCEELEGKRRRLIRTVLPDDTFPELIVYGPNGKPQEVDVDITY